jgi:hypothetical protein
VIKNLENEEVKARILGCENTTTMGCNARKTNKETITRQGYYKRKRHSQRYVVSKPLA